MNGGQAVLKERMQKLIEQANVELIKVEKEYIENNGLLSTNQKLTDLKVNEDRTRFSDAYIERSLKETDELINTESGEFLNNSIHYLKENIAEFIYIESKWFEVIGIDAISLEVDDVFGTYEAMFGLKLKKNEESNIRAYVKENGLGEKPKYNLLFNQQDGLWDMNLTLDHIEGFNDNMSIDEVLRFIYEYLFKLTVQIEKR